MAKGAKVLQNQDGGCSQERTLCNPDEPQGSCEVFEHHCNNQGQNESSYYVTGIMITI